MVRWHSLSGARSAWWVGIEPYRSQEATAAVCIVHGFRAWHRWGFFPYVAESLVQCGFHAYCIALPSSGYGPDGFSAERFAQATVSLDCAALRWALEWMHSRHQVVYGLGHSRGSLLLLLQWRQFRGLVLWMPPSRFGHWSQRQLEQWRRQETLPAGTHPETGQQLVLSISVLEDLQTQYYNEQLASALAACDIPVCIVAGEQDVVTPSSHAQHLAAQMRRCRLCLLKEAGHTFGIEHPMKQPSPALHEALRVSCAFFQHIHQQ